MPRRSKGRGRVEPVVFKIRCQVGAKGPGAGSAKLCLRRGLLVGFAQQHRPHGSDQGDEFARRVEPGVQPHKRSL
jgi:hypothetical protein